MSFTLTGVWGTGFPCAQQVALLVGLLQVLVCLTSNFKHCPLPPFLKILLLLINQRTGDWQGRRIEKALNRGAVSELPTDLQKP